MARLFTTGIELGHAVAAGLTVTGSAAAATDQSRTGTYSLKCPTGVGTSYGTFAFTGVTGRDYYARTYYRTSALVNGAIIVEFLAGGTGAWAELVLSGTAGAVALNTSTTAALATSAAGVIAANAWTLVEYRCRVNTAGNDEHEVRVNGVQVLLHTTATFATTVLTGVVYGQDGSAVAANQWHDDMALNDDQGAYQNSWAGAGSVRRMSPAGMVQAGTGWLKPGGAATNLHTAVDNVPSTGVAHSTLVANAEQQVYNITSTTTGDLRLTMQSYAAAGVPADDNVTLVQAVAVTGASATTGTPTGSLEVISNPAVAELNFGQFRGAANAAAFPTGWIQRRGNVSYFPNVVRGTGPVVEVGKRTASTTAVLASQVALLVESAPLPTSDHLTPTDAGVGHVKRWLHLSNAPVNQVSIDGASVGQRYDAVCLHAATTQIALANAIRAAASAASRTCHVGFYVDLLYADDGGGDNTVFTAAECRANGWLALEAGVEIINPWGGTAKMVDLGKAGVKEAALTKIRALFAAGVTAGLTGGGYDFVFLDDVNMYFDALGGGAADGYADYIDWKDRALVPCTKYLSRWLWSDGVKFVIPNLGDWTGIWQLDDVAAESKGGVNELWSNGSPRAAWADYQIDQIYSSIRIAADNGRRYIGFTQAVDDSPPDELTVRYGWALANIMGEFASTYHMSAWPVGDYGRDVQITEHTYNLGAPTQAPQRNLRLFSRTFANYTLYANTGSAPVTLPDSSSLGALEGKFVSTAGTNYSRSTGDAAPSTDAIVRAAARPRAVADAAPAADAVTRTRSRIRALADTAGASDAVAALRSRSVATADSAPATDVGGGGGTPPSSWLVTDFEEFPTGSPPFYPWSSLYNGQGTSPEAFIETFFAPGLAASALERAARANFNFLKFGGSGDWASAALWPGDGYDQPADQGWSFTIVEADGNPWYVYLRLAGTYVGNGNAVVMGWDGGAYRITYLQDGVLAGDVANPVAAGVAVDDVVRVRAFGTTYWLEVSYGGSAYTTIWTGSIPEARNGSGGFAAESNGVFALDNLHFEDPGVPGGGASLTTLVQRGRNIADTAGASDAVTRSAAAARSLAETATASDAVTRQSSRSRSIADSAPATDALTRLRAAVRALAESAPAADALSRVRAAVRAAADSAPLTSDVVSRVTGGKTANTSDSAPAADAVTRLQTALRGLAASAPAADALTRAQALARATGATGGGASLVAEVMADGPLGFWRQLHGATNGQTVADDSGNGRYLTVFDSLGTDVTSVGSLIPSALADPAMSFKPGANLWNPEHYLEFNDATIRATCTIVGWMSAREADTATWQDVMRNRTFGVVIRPGRKLAAYALINGSDVFSDDATGRAGSILPQLTIAENTRYHVAFVYEAAISEMRLYINGVLDSKWRHPTTDGLSVDAGSWNSFCIGTNQDALHGYDGVADEVALYNKLLSPTRLLAHYVAGMGTGGAGDAAPAADAVLRQVARLRLTGDSAPAVDTFGSGQSVIKATGDSAPAADAVTRQAARTKAVADSAPAADAPTRQGVFSRLVADSAPAADAAARAVARVRAAADSAPAADALTRAAGLARTLTDTATAADALARVAARVRGTADSAPAADAVARLAAAVRALADSAPAADAVTGLRVRVRATADAVTGSDSVARVAARVRATADAVGGSDAVTRTAVAVRVIADAAPAADAVGKALARTRATGDSAPAADAITFTTGKGANVADAAPASDAVARRAAYGRQPADSAPVADAVARMTAAARAVADAAPAADLVARASSRSKQTADSAPAADAVARVRSAVRGPTDSAPATDGVTQHGIYGRGLADAAPASDTPNRGQAVARGLTDAAPASDTVVGVIALQFARYLRVLTRRRRSWALVRHGKVRAEARVRRAWARRVDD